MAVYIAVVSSCSFAEEYLSKDNKSQLLKLMHIQRIFINVTSPHIF